MFSIIIFTFTLLKRDAMTVPWPMKATFVLFGLRAPLLNVN